MVIHAEVEEQLKVSFVSLSEMDKESTVMFRIARVIIPHSLNIWWRGILRLVIWFKFLYKFERFNIVTITTVTYFNSTRFYLALKIMVSVSPRNVMYPKLVFKLH